MSDCSDSISSLSLTDLSPVTLSDLSPRDKPWDKHRANAEIVTDYYAQGESHHQQYSKRVTACSRLLDFRLVPDPVGGTLQFNLSDAHFCRVRFCTVCQWRRSLRWRARAYDALPEVMQAYPTYRWLFLTLTIKNCSISDLKKTIGELNKAFNRLTKLKAWRGEGWIKSVEVTRGSDGHCHPHLHVLLIVKPSFFTQYYISHSKWVDLWQKCLRVNYKPVVDVRAIKGKHSPATIIPEILKYQTKEDDLTADQEWFLKYADQMHRVRATAVGGILRRYFRELEQEPDDLIGKDDAANTPDEGHLYFQWKKHHKKYYCVDS